MNSLTGLFKINQVYGKDRLGQCIAIMTILSFVVAILACLCSLCKAQFIDHSVAWLNLVLIISNKLNEDYLMKLLFMLVVSIIVDIGWVMFLYTDDI